MGIEMSLQFAAIIAVVVLALAFLVKFVADQNAYNKQANDLARHQQKRDEARKLRGW